MKIKKDKWLTTRDFKLPCWFYSYNGCSWGISYSTNTQPSVWSHWMPLTSIVPNSPEINDPYNKCKDGDYNQLELPSMG